MSFVCFFLKFRLHFWCQLCLEIIDCGKKHKLVSCFSVFCRLFIYFFYNLASCHLAKTFTLWLRGWKTGGLFLVVIFVSLFSWSWILFLIFLSKKKVPCRGFFYFLLSLKHWSAVEDVKNVYSPMWVLWENIARLWTYRLNCGTARWWYTLQGVSFNVQGSFNVVFFFH